MVLTIRYEDTGETETRDFPRPIHHDRPPVLIGPTGRHGGAPIRPTLCRRLLLAAKTGTCLHGLLGGGLAYVMRIADG